MSEISMADVHRLLHVLHSNGLIRPEDIARLVPAAHLYPTEHAPSVLAVSEKLVAGPTQAAPALLDKAKLVFGILKDKSTFGDDGVAYQRAMREEWQ